MEIEVEMLIRDGGSLSIEKVQMEELPERILQLLTDSSKEITIKRTSSERDFIISEMAGIKRDSKNALSFAVALQDGVSFARKAIIALVPISLLALVISICTALLKLK